MSTPLQHSSSSAMTTLLRLLADDGCYCPQSDFNIYFSSDIIYENSNKMVENIDNLSKCALLIHIKRKIPHAVNKWFDTGLTVRDSILSLRMLRQRAPHAGENIASNNPSSTQHRVVSSRRNRTRRCQLEPSLLVLSVSWIRNNIRLEVAWKRC